FLAGFLNEILGFLLRYPLGKLGEALREVPAGYVSQLRLNLGYIRDAVADIADAGLSGDLGRHGPVHGLAEKLGDLADRPLPAAPHIVYVAGRLLVLESEDEGLRDILHMDEVPALAAILEDHRRLSVVQPG